MANADRAFDFAQIPNHGIGLAAAGIHLINPDDRDSPRALLEYSPPRATISAPRSTVALPATDDPVSFYVRQASRQAIATLPPVRTHPVIVRTVGLQEQEYAIWKLAVKQ